MTARYRQGSSHSFLVVKDAGGKVIGVGDAISVARGNQVTSRLTLRFRDGSVDDETAVFVQGGALRVVTDHHVQKGPSYPKPLDIAVNSAKNEVTWRDEHGERKTEQMELPPDLANGILPVVLQNMPKGAQELKVSYVNGSPKPRLVKLAIRPEGEDSFTVGGVRRRALQYDIHVEIGGIAGVIAPVIGKDPADLHIWTSSAEAATVLRMDAALYLGGPIWTLESASPVW